MKQGQQDEHTELSRGDDALHGRILPEACHHSTARCAVDGQITCRCRLPRNLDLADRRLVMKESRRCAPWLGRNRNRCAGPTHSPDSPAPGMVRRSLVISSTGSWHKRPNEAHSLASALVEDPCRSEEPVPQALRG